MDEMFPARIHYTFRTEPQATLRPAHGVWGGVTPHGEIEMCFYDETSNPPESSDQTIGPDGRPGIERMAGDANVRQITRNIHSRILLNYQNARAIMEWLEDRLNELDDTGQSNLYDVGSGIQQ